MTNAELKPCPFCGTIPILKEIGLDGWRIYCCRYGDARGCLTFGDSIMSRKEMVKAWNTRPQDNNALVPLDEDIVGLFLYRIISDKIGLELLKEYWTAKHIQTETKLNASKYAKMLCAKFGKDNSGMVSLELIKELELLKSYFEDRMEVVLHRNDIKWKAIDDFLISAQQPPKERKVSLEDIQNVIYFENRKQSKYLSMIDIHNIAEAILSLLNATEERKGE